MVLINELYYDHPGSDGGYEWIEFYNMSNSSIDLSGWKVEYGGSEFILMFEFPDITIAAHEFLVAGDVEVIVADITIALNFQNGGSATDGVRIVSPDSSWTDTVLYDVPNSNNLIDDRGNIGSSFAPDVIAGNSLGRFPDGLDTNSGSDWKERHRLTCGNENTGEIDLAIEVVTIEEVFEEYHLFTSIRNLSTEGVDNSCGYLDIYLNGAPLESFTLPQIAADEVVEYEMNLTSQAAGYQLTELSVNSIYDYALGNNSGGASILIGTSPIVFNELMINPAAGKEEWVELLITGNVDNIVDNLLISDETGTEYAFIAGGSQSGYCVAGAEKLLLIEQYAIPESQIMETAGFPSLNNAGDELVIRDVWGTRFDSVSYDEAGGEIAGISYEKINPEADDSEWNACIAEAGHTAAAENSIVCGIIDVNLQLLSVSHEDGAINHQIMISNSGMQDVMEGILVISWKNLLTGDEDSYEEYLVWENDAILLNTMQPDMGYYSYEYFLEIAGDSNIANNSAEWFLNLQSLPWVVNEIMYHPASDEPEWIEIKSNLEMPLQVDLWIKVDDDSCALCSAAEYLIITGDEADREQIKAKYGVDLHVFCGLGRLTDDGSNLQLGDVWDNEMEAFCYASSWNQDIQGVSIERVNSLIPAIESNWSRCTDDCTPGRANSIYVEEIPDMTGLSIKPKVFSPRLGETTVISYQNKNNLNKVRVRIYDLKGRLIKLLADQEFCGMDGIYCWDGRNDQGNFAAVGVYIILFESSSGENSFSDKATVVVAW